MKKHLTNAGYGVLDYVSYPAGMLLVAPIVLHKLGAAEYGLWMIATAVISAGGMIASGFCDACIQRVAHLRGAGQFSLMPETARSMLGINLALGFVLAAGVWIAAPLAASRIAMSQLTQPAECLISLRIASIAILLRAIESVAVGAQRAFERYRGTVQISTAMRLATLASAAVLTLFGLGTNSILVATAAFLALGAAMQFRELCKLMGASLWPRFHVAETRILLSQGFFVWLQALGGVVFGQLDRILLGVSLGALVVAPYSLCVQFAHPIYGLAVSGLNFLFPYFSARASTVSHEELKRAAIKAFACNLILVTCGAGLLLVFGDHLIRIWAGPAVAQSASGILPPIVIGSALMGLSVTGTYAMQALGRFRTVALISLAGRSAMLLPMIEMLRHEGLHGLALSRLLYGSVALMVYLPLLQQLNVGRKERISSLAIPIGAQEGSKP
jgi:O-antigen/teichoic acid export membrane protein